jgi:1-acyl-sn-glycerol-3-phosphate acyltransferase
LLAAILNFFYGLYAWLVFILCVAVSILVTLFVPGLDRRRRWVTAACRGLFRAVAIPVHVDGIGHLPPGHCIVVANHASYLDGVILQAFLPPRFSYVIKGEMRNVPIAHFLLRRLGSKFVERFVTSGSARDARGLLKAAAAGESLAFFPEGTFVEEVGLGRFRNGAFTAAIKAELPVVPVVIRGSRHILPAGHILPRHGRLQLDILAAINPSEAAFSNAARLAEESRNQIMTVLEEPDLTVDMSAQI